MDGKEQTNTYCGCKLPPKQLHERDKVNVTFYNSQPNQAGFLLHYKAVGTKCSVVFKVCGIVMIMTDTER